VTVVVTATQVRMANDIAAQFRYLPPEAAVTAIVTHLRSFWDPRMRAQLRRYIAEGGTALDPLVIEAAAQL
jgi:formate dehydrogenase subunit delta